jgi:putative phosphoesterase
MRLAFFSDVHSNLPAPGGVLADIAAVGVDERYALGDLVGYAPWPNEVLERLQAEGITSVMGNYDEGTGSSEANKAWLRSLPREIRFEADGKRYLLVHGSPRRINEYLYEDKPDATFARIAEGAKADVIVCGHTHKPYDKTVGSARFVNDGSAGKPKDGNPRVCWAMLDTATGAIDLRRVEYDVEKTAQAILASDLPPEFAAQVREARGYAPMPTVAG